MTDQINPRCKGACCSSWKPKSGCTFHQFHSNNPGYCCRCQRAEAKVARKEAMAGKPTSHCWECMEAKEYHLGHAHQCCRCATIKSSKTKYAKCNRRAPLDVDPVLSIDIETLPTPGGLFTSVDKRRTFVKSLWEQEKAARFVGNYNARDVMATYAFLGQKAFDRPGSGPHHSCNHFCHQKGYDYCDQCVANHPELRYEKCLDSETGRTNDNHCFSAYSHKADAWSIPLEVRTKRAYVDFHERSPNKCCHCGFVKIDIEKALRQHTFHTAHADAKAREHGLRKYVPQTLREHEEVTFMGISRSTYPELRADRIGQEAPLSVLGLPPKEMQGHMFIQQLKNIKDNLERVDVDEMVVLSSAAKSASASYADYGLPVPEWLQEASSTLDKEIKFRRRDQLEKELKSARARKEALKSAEEKKTDLDEQIKKLEAALGA